MRKKCHDQKHCKIVVKLDNSLDNVAIAKGWCSEAVAVAVGNCLYQDIYDNKVVCEND